MENNHRNSKTRSRSFTKRYNKQKDKDQFISEHLRKRYSFSSWTKLLMEGMSSFLLIIFLLLPGAYNNGEVLFGNPLQTINQITILMILWILLFNAAFQFVFRRYGVYVSPLPVFYAKAKKTESTSYLIRVFIVQALGATAATFVMYFFVNYSDYWVEGVSSLGAMKPVMRGFIVSGVVPLGFFGEIWFIALQGLISFIMIAFVATIDYLLYKNKFSNSKNIFLKRSFMIFFVMLFSIHFSAHPINIWRMSIPAFVTYGLGGVNVIPTAISLTVGQVLGYWYIYKLYNRKR